MKESLSENVSSVWSGSDYPYLKSVETAGENAYSQYSSEVVLTKEQLFDKLKQVHPDIEIDYSKDDCIKILEYTESGRVKTIKLGNTEIAGTEARKIFELRSTNFSVKIDGENITFIVIGYGHGVGMSQTGANSMAKEGKKCEDIIKHFYTNVEIKYENEI